MKLFIGGSLIAREGWMFEPYKGTDTSGISYYTTEQLTGLFTKFEKMNRRVMAHAIGDRAVRDVLNAIEAAKKINPDSTIRRHPTHNTLADPEDIKRFAKFGVAFEVSPVMVLSPGSIKMFDEILGRKLLTQGWALRSAYDSGAMVAMATDWKVSLLDPWHVIGWTVSRINHKYPDMVDIAPEMKITMEEAIKAYTLGAAYSLSKENEIGSIEIGKFAALIPIPKLSSVEPTRNCSYMPNLLVFRS